MQKNVLLITADQWRGDCLSAMKHAQVRTPNLDQLATEGVLFSRHFAGAAPCGPARACLYTGLYQMNNRVCTNGTPLDRRHDTVAKAARRSGYDPVLFGYTDQSEMPDPARGDDPDLKTYEGVLPGLRPELLLPEHSAPWLGWLKRQGLPVDALSIPAIYQPVSGPQDPPTMDPPHYSQDQTQTAYLVNHLIDWLQSRHYQANPTGKGWFAHLSLLMPHPPFVVPEPYNQYYNPADITDPIPVSAADEHPFLQFMRLRQSKGQFVPGLSGKVCEWSTDVFRTLAAIYYGMMTEVDHQLGRVFAELKAQGYWDNTLIVFTSDHGEQMGDHGLLGKLGHYDSSYHIPLIIRDPQQTGQHGKQTQAFSEAVDVMPTILDWLDASPQTIIDGVSLLRALSDEVHPDERDSVHWEYTFSNPQRLEAETEFGLSGAECTLAVMRSEKFKYVHYAGLPPVLFDLEQDPDETTNVVSDPAYSDIRLSMAEQLLAWRARHLDQRYSQTIMGLD